MKEKYVRLNICFFEKDKRWLDQQRKKPPYETTSQYIRRLIHEDRQRTKVIGSRDHRTG